MTRKTIPLAKLDKVSSAALAEAGYMPTERHVSRFAAEPPPFMPEADIVLDLPVPLSVNRTRKINNGERKMVCGWTKRADALVLAAKCRTREPVKLNKLPRFELVIVLSEHLTKMDLDNGVKWVIDYLRRIELIEDDSPKHMRRLTVEWGLAPEGCRVIARAAA